MKNSKERGLETQRFYIRLGAEGILIVLSILMAFGIEAWWAGRQEALHLRADLNGLAVGLEESRARISERAEPLARAEKALTRFITMDPAAAAGIPADSAWQYVSAIQRPFTGDDNLSFLRQALSADLVDRVEDPRFHAAVAQWREVVNQLAELDAAIVDHWLEALRVLGEREALGPALAGQGNSVAPGVLRQLREDPVVYGLAVRRSTLMRLQVRFLGELDEAEADLLLAVQELVDR